MLLWKFCSCDGNTQCIILPTQFQRDPFLYDIPILNKEDKNSINYTKYTIHPDLLFNLEQIHEGFFVKKFPARKTGGKTYKAPSIIRMQSDLGKKKRQNLFGLGSIVSETQETARCFITEAFPSETINSVPCAIQMNSFHCSQLKCHLKLS